MPHALAGKPAPAEILIDADGLVVVSRAILAANRGKRSGFADGIVVTPSHNPPADGGLKYTPPQWGPSRDECHGVDSGSGERASARRQSGREAPVFRGRAQGSHHAPGGFRCALRRRPDERRRHEPDPREPGQAATPSEKAKFKQLSPSQVKSSSLAGEPIRAVLTKAPGNGAAIGGLKVVAENGWFAARPSGTENAYKIYAESFAGDAHLQKILEEARSIVGAAVAEPRT